MPDKKKCYLSLDWDKVFDVFSKHVGKTIKPTTRVSQAYIAFIEEEINRACEKLVENNEKDIYKSIRYKYQYGASKIECIKECRTINRTLSLKEAKDLVESWDK